MGWSYNPKDAVQTLEPGDYPAIVSKVEDTHSKVKEDGTGGNPMRVVEFEVFAGDVATKLREFFVQGQAVAVRRMKSLAEALGASKDFEAGTFDAANHLQESLVLTLKVDGEFNRIAKFAPTTMAAAIKSQAMRPAAAPSRGKPDLTPLTDDDIPF